MTRRGYDLKIAREQIRRAQWQLVLALAGTLTAIVVCALTVIRATPSNVSSMAMGAVIVTLAALVCAYRATMISWRVLDLHSRIRDLEAGP